MGAVAGPVCLLLVLTLSAVVQCGGAAVHSQTSTPASRVSPLHEPHRIGTQHSNGHVGPLARPSNSTGPFNYTHYQPQPPVHQPHLTRPVLPDDVRGLFLSLKPKTFLTELIDVGLNDTYVSEFQQKTQSHFAREVENLTVERPVWHFSTDANATKQREEVDQALALQQKWFDFVLNSTKTSSEATANATKAITQFKRMFQEGVCQPNRQRAIRTAIGVYFDTHPEYQRKRFVHHVFGSAIAHGLQLVSLDTVIPFTAMSTKEREAANAKMDYGKAFERFKEHNIQTVLNLNGRNMVRKALHDLEGEFKRIHLL